MLCDRFAAGTSELSHRPAVQDQHPAQGERELPVSVGRRDKRHLSERVRAPRGGRRLDPLHRSELPGAQRPDRALARPEPGGMRRQGGVYRHGHGSTVLTLYAVRSPAQPTRPADDERLQGGCNGPAASEPGYLQRTERRSHYGDPNHLRPTVETTYTDSGGSFGPVQRPTDLLKDCPKATCILSNGKTNRRFDMGSRFLALLGALAMTVAVASLASAPVAGQAPSAATNTTSAAQRTQKWTPPRTAWGRPDLQGIWNNATTTPLERPDKFSGKTVLSDEELSQLTEEVGRLRNTDQAPPQGDPGTYNEFWWERGKPINQTSLILDPPDGKLPSLTPEGQKRADAAAANRRGRGPADSWEDRGLGERCIIYRGIPTVPTGYN